MSRLASTCVLVALLAAGAIVASAGGAPVGVPSAVSITVTPGGATCAYSETATPKVKCANLKNQRIKSGTRITIVAKANAALPAGWKLFIFHQYAGPNRNAFISAGGAKPRDSFPGPYPCSTTTGSSCTMHAHRIAPLTTFDLFRAVVQKADGTNFEAQMWIRWCDKSTAGCVGSR